MWAIVYCLSFWGVFFFLLFSFVVYVVGVMYNKLIEFFLVLPSWFYMCCSHWVWALVLCMFYVLLFHERIWRSESASGNIGIVDFSLCFVDSA